MRPFEPLPSALETALAGLDDLDADARRMQVETMCDRHPDLAERIRAIAHELAGMQADAQPLADPDRIGPYEVLQKLGEGGMGAVYLCQQDEPVRLQVAVKLIRVGMATKEVLARFEAERQALALMNHPNIAHVIGAGATQDGRPYFVMEHVPGVPLGRYCDDNKLTVRQRLQLFVPIAQAVQHAHHKGIIHRDLKPGNVLVMLQDGKPVPKVIDFGLAKATQSHLTEQSFYTEQGRVLGTPEYMSPEQADLTSLDIDTRTDVYSLGVILYELLTGELPFDRAALRQAGFTAIQRVIKEVEPPKPSARATALGNAGETAKWRRTELRHLARELRGELDWVTLKALEKDRTRRYATPLELAGDVERYLRGEPVLAGPPSGWYRTRRYLRRHRGPLLTAGAVIAALSVGTAMAQQQRNEADAQRQVAQHEAHKARSSESRATASEAEALQSLADFRRMADVKRSQDLVREADEELWPAVPGKIPAMEQWLAKAESLRSRESLHRDKLVALEGALGAHLPAAEREETVWQRDTEQALLATLSSLLDRDWHKPTLASVRKRIEDAQRAHEDLTVTYAKEWAEALATIADETKCPLYKGLSLEPQLGLVPLGRNEGTGLYEFWHPASGEKPEWRGGDGKVRIEDGTGMVFVLVPGGAFWMGAQRGKKDERNYDPAAEDRESPVSKVDLSPFFLAGHEMTQGQWLRWTGTNPSRRGPRVRPGTVMRHNPVNETSWDDCQRVLRQMGLELPTEAQWEYACRAGTTTVFATGNDVASLKGSVNLADAGSSIYFREERNREPGFDDGHSEDAPVGIYRPNAWGLFDMQGNVKEWCRDYGTSYSLEPGPGTGERPGDSSDLRAARGASFYSVASGARSASRLRYTRLFRSWELGVRPARPVQL